MKVYQLIEKLKQLPKNYEVRIDSNINNTIEDYDPVNYWVYNVELHRKGASGYEVMGEVVILGSE